jgi:hypothetical protein
LGCKACFAPQTAKSLAHNSETFGKTLVKDSATASNTFPQRPTPSPTAALEFFAGVGELSGATITPIREEQLQKVLGSRYRKLDVPLQVEWPDGRRAGVVFVVEEETEPRRFSIHRLAHYCLDLAELLKTAQIVPVVIFLRSGEFPRELRLGDGEAIYLSFRFIHCELARLPAERYLDSANIVARLNLPNMRHPRERRVEVYARALNGLLTLEPDWHKQRKYAEFIDAYADLSEGELARYSADYLNETGDNTMGLVATLLEEGRQQGRQEGEMAILLRLLALKFGPLPEPIAEKVRRADAETLLQWGERILTAATAEEVIKD